MTRVYGGCIEPEGWDRHWRCERAEGSLNIYTGLACVSCGHEEGERPDVD